MTAFVFFSMYIYLFKPCRVRGGRLLLRRNLDVARVSRSLFAISDAFSKPKPLMRSNRITVAQSCHGVSMLFNHLISYKPTALRYSYKTLASRRTSPVFNQPLLSLSIARQSLDHANQETQDEAKHHKDLPLAAEQALLPHQPKAAGRPQEAIHHALDQHIQQTGDAKLIAATSGPFGTAAAAGTAAREPIPGPRPVAIQPLVLHPPQTVGTRHAVGRVARSLDARELQPQSIHLGSREASGRQAVEAAGPGRRARRRRRRSGCPAATPNPLGGAGSVVSP